MVKTLLALMKIKLPQRPWYSCQWASAVIENAQFSQSADKDSEELPRFYKLPYLGDFSNYVDRKVLKLIRKYCKDGTKIRLIFTPFKIGSLFSLKDRPLFSLKSNVIYKFTCASCTAIYVGETIRYISVRINEHLNKDKQSHINKHLSANPACKELCDEVSAEDKRRSLYRLAETLFEQTGPFA